MNPDVSSKFEKINVIDSHVHPIRGLTSGKTLIKEMDVAGISKAVLLALDLDPEVFDTDSKLKDETIDDLFAYSFFMDHFKVIETMKRILEVGKTSNTAVAKLVSQYPDRFIGFGSVNPSKDKRYVKNKLEEIINLNLNGIKLIQTLQFFDPQKNKNLNNIFKFAKKFDLSVLIHLGQDPGPWEIPTLRCVQNSHPKNWVKLVKKHSKNKIIFAHLGGYGKTDDSSWFNAVIEMMKTNDNIFLDTSAVTYQLEIPAIVDKIRNSCDFQKILFGSDTPVVQGTSMLHSRKIIENSPIITYEEKIKMLSKNAIDLFKIY